MTEAQIKKMAKQLRAGADGYAMLRKALQAAQVANPTPGVARAAQGVKLKKVRKMLLLVARDTVDWLAAMTKLDAAEGRK